MDLKVTPHLPAQIPRHQQDRRRKPHFGWTRRGRGYAFFGIGPLSAADNLMPARCNSVSLKLDRVIFGVLSTNYRSGRGMADCLPSGYSANPNGADYSRS